MATPSPQAVANGDIIVLGLDPGSNVTGYGLVAERSGQVRLLEAGTIRTRQADEAAARLATIFSRVSTLITAYQPHEAAIENVFVAHNVASALKLGQARGAALAACGVHGLAVSGYEPTKVKKSLVGVGRAEKEQVAFMVAQILGQKNPKWAKDASDALAIAICHLNTRRFNRLTSAS
ncbi:MAG: crossover junction endodeoxyribonuclease RuvC [Desulfovibrionaceae bacterium]